MDFRFFEVSKNCIFYLVGFYGTTTGFFSLSKGCLPAMITIVIHKRSPAKISTKIFARHRHRQHDHGDGQTVLPLTWLNWFHRHNNPNYFSAMIFRLTSNWFLFHVKVHLLVCVVSRDDDYLNLNCCIPWYQISF